jgi:hypothetical protein
MKNFYVTYGCGTDLCNCYSVVQGIDYDDAKDIYSFVTKKIMCGIV